MENQNNIINQVPRVSGILGIVQVATSVLTGAMFIVNMFFANSSNDKRISNVEIKQDKVEKTQEQDRKDITGAIGDLKTETVRLRTILEENKKK